MSVTRSTFRSGHSLAALALTAALLCTAHAGSRQQGRPIEFSQPRSFDVITNLQQLATKKDPLKQLEEDLNRPLQTFAPKSFLEAVVAPTRRPPAPSALQSKRAKELLERRNDWIFMTPEDLVTAPTVEQILKAPEYGPDGYPKKDLPALERYYQSLVSKHDAQGKPVRPKAEDWLHLYQESTKADATPTREERDLPDGLKASTEALRNALEPGHSDSPFDIAAAPAPFPDPFRLTSKPAPNNHLADHKKLMDEYRLLVDPTWRPPVTWRTASPTLGLIDASRATPSPASALPAVPNPTLRRGPGALPDPLNPVLGPAPLPDLNARALGQTRSAAAASTVPERRVIPKAPDFSAPRRAF